jgi:hypothetical protein
MIDKVDWLGVPQQVATVVSSSTSAALLPDYKIWKPTPLPPGHQVYALIGRVASEWSHFEHMLDLIIWSLANIEPEKGACITAQIMGPVPRLRTIITQLNQINTEESKLLAEEFKQLMNNCHDVAEHRNRLIHDAWYLYTPSGNPGQFKSMSFKDPRYGIFQVDVDDINETLERIARRQESASRLQERVMKVLKS